MINDLSDAIMDCAVPVTVTRYHPNSRVKGRSNAPIARKFEAMLSVQPLNERELQRLPEGDRNQSRVKAYGEVELMTVNTSKCEIPDEFEYRGITYQIDDFEDWADLGGYFKYGATRKNR